MENDLHTKLVAILNSTKLIIYEAKGIKIIGQIGKFSIVTEKHHHHDDQKSQSHYQQKSTPKSLFEPHSQASEVEYAEAAKSACKILEEKVQNNRDYNKLIIVAEPKMLGSLRSHMSNSLKKLLYKEISKNLINEDVKSIEHNVFC
jgi:protein required for attachment to host cells